MSGQLQKNGSNWKESLRKSSQTENTNVTHFLLFVGLLFMIRRLMYNSLTLYFE